MSSFFMYSQEFQAIVVLFASWFQKCMFTIINLKTIYKMDTFLGCGAYPRVRFLGTLEYDGFPWGPRSSFWSRLFGFILGHCYIWRSVASIGYMDSMDSMHPMGFHGYPWSPWTCMDINGIHDIRESMESWIFMESMDIHGIHGINGFAWNP